MERLNNSMLALDNSPETKEESFKSNNYEKEKLAELLKYYRGNRSNATFSNDAGVSVGNMSRLLNAKSQSRPRKEIFSKIALSEKDKNPNVIFAELCRAAGYDENEINLDDYLEKQNKELPAFAKRKSFCVTFMTEYLLNSEMIDINFVIHSHDGWFSVESKKEKIVCIAALFDKKEPKDKDTQILQNYLVALTIHSDSNKVYILTNKSKFFKNVGNILPKRLKSEYYIMLTNDCKNIADCKPIFDEK